MNELYYAGYKLEKDLGLCKIFDELSNNDDVIIIEHGRDTLIHEMKYTNTFSSDMIDTGKTHIGFEHSYIHFYYKGMIYHVEPSSPEIMVGSPYYYTPFKLIDGWYENQAGYQAAFKGIESLDGNYQKIKTNKIDRHVSRSIPFYTRKDNFEEILNKKGGFRERDIYSQPHICYGIQREGEVSPSVIRCTKLERDSDGVRKYFDINIKIGEIIN